MAQVEVQSEAEIQAFYYKAPLNGLNMPSQCID
jgi:hypothetical protein